MLRHLLLQMHAYIGLSAGLVLAVVGATGALLSFETPIIQALSRDALIVNVPANTSKLAPAALTAQLAIAAPDKIPASLTYAGAADEATSVTFVGEPRGTSWYVDPYTGVITGQPSGRAFMGEVRRLHRWLLLDIDLGRPIVGVATALLLFLALSGLYLRRPTRLRGWRRWLTLNGHYHGRVFFHQLHAVAGTWVLVFYLLAAGTGLWWSFDWYRAGLNALAGIEQSQKPRGPAHDEVRSPAPSTTAQDAAWNGFLSRVGNDFQWAQWSLPANAKAPLTLRYLSKDAAHERAVDVMQFAPATGDFVALKRYADKSRGERAIASIFPLHAGSFFGTPGLWLMSLASLVMPLLFITGLWLYLRRPRRADKVKTA